jgi:hypothetical protein
MKNPAGVTGGKILSESLSPQSEFSSALMLRSEASLEKILEEVIPLMRLRI